MKSGINPKIDYFRSKMANITQFARQHSKKNIFITQFSEDLEDRLEMKDFYGGGGEAVVDTRRSLKKKSRHEVRHKHGVLKLKKTRNCIT